MMPQWIRMVLIAVCLLTPLSSVDAAKPKEAAEFWVTEKIHTIHVQVTAAQWQKMQPVRAKEGRPLVAASSVPRPTASPSTRPALAAPATRPTIRGEGQRLRPNFYGMQFAYVKGSVEVDGVAMKDVGVRLRGNSSFNWGGTTGRKRPFKVDFNRFVDGQKFRGITSFYLNSNAYDPSFLRETLGYELFRTLGVAAPRTTFALVYLTIDGQTQREPLGVYTLIEDIDSKAFLKERFDSGKGMLLKPWSIRGWPYMGEQWPAYVAHYNPQGDVTPEGAKRLIEFVKLVNYADDATFRAQIEQYLDVDRLLRFVAGHVILSNLDTILYTGHNHYLYLNPKDNRFRALPWDLNLSFANFTSAASVEQHLHLSILRPHLGEAKIIDRLLAVPRYRQMYEAHIRNCMASTFNTAAMSARIKALQAVLAKAEAMDEAEWRGRFVKATTQPSTRPVAVPPRPRSVAKGWQGEAAIPLMTFVERRTASLTAQLAGQTEGYSPAPQPPPAPPPGGLKANPAFGNLALITMAIIRGADGNCDSRLTAAEVRSAVEEFARGAAGAQGMLDQSKLTQAIVQAARRIGPRREGGEQRRGNRGEFAAPWAGAIVKAAGAAQEGRFTVAQAVAAADRAFAQADADKSGRLDSSELLGLLDAMAAASPPVPPATTRPVIATTAKPTTQPVRR